MKRLTVISLLMATAAMATPILADNELPRGWKGLEDVYQCDPAEWVRTSQGIWNNPTCVSISGGGNPEPLPVVLPPDDEDDEDDEGDGGEGDGDGGDGGGEGDGDGGDGGGEGDGDGGDGGDEGEGDGGDDCACAEPVTETQIG